MIININFDVESNICSQNYRTKIKKILNKPNKEIINSLYNDISIRRNKTRFIPYKNIIINENENKFVNNKFDIITILLEEFNYKNNNLHVNFKFEIDNINNEIITDDIIKDFIFDAFNETYSNENSIITFEYGNNNNIYYLEIIDIPKNIIYNIL
jgi:hypothetical protein